MEQRLATLHLMMRKIMTIIFEIENIKMEKSQRTVVKIITNNFMKGNDIVQQKTIRFLKRKSTGFNQLLEDCMNIGTNDALKSIVNLDECSDGVYEVVLNDWITDWETGMIEDRNWKLIPYIDKG